MHPLDTKSCLKRSMQHVLRALRNNKDVLLHIMDVFASDPLVEWSRPSSSTEGDDGATPQSRRKQAHSTGKHNPLSRIQSALRKLNGDHPSHIMCADIDESVHPSLEKSKNLMKQIVLERCFALSYVRSEWASHRSMLSDALSECCYLARNGDKRFNLRASMSESALSVAEQVKGPARFHPHLLPTATLTTVQVDALMDQATDPNILGRTWRGWAPFL